MELIKKLYREEEAQGMTEYALILAAIIGAVYAAATFTPLKTALQDAFTTIGDKLGNVIGG